MLKIKRNKTKKKKEKKKSNLPLRTNILFLIVFLLFASLILRLGYTQIVRGEEFLMRAQVQTDNTLTRSVPRGLIFDRNGQVVVGNSAQRAIVYSRGENVNATEILEIAENLAEMIVMDTDHLTQRGKQDFWIIRNPEEASALVTEEEQRAMRASGSEAERSTAEIDREIYSLQLERIAEQNLIENLTDEDLQVLAIYARMSAASANSTVIIKTGSDEDGNQLVTDEEFARVSENLYRVPGIDAIIDWERKYPFEGLLLSILGRVSSTEEGLPSDRLDYFLSRGYSRNDRVGISYIEQVFESYLRGQEATLEVNRDSQGNVLNYTTIQEGHAGYDLITTFDMELQLRLDEMLEEELWEANNASSTATSAYVVMMDPRTGQVRAMAGKQIVRDANGQRRMVDHALGTISSAYAVGSSIKGATVLAGFHSGAIHHGTQIFDRPLYIQGTPRKASIFDMGVVNDLQALYQSSNVYMFETVIRMGGGRYQTNGPLHLAPDTMERLRYYFNQFGLGVLTGIDLPNEARGFIGQDTLNPGFTLDLAIGQYDTYTAMQLVQYVSTIANGGYRMKPQIAHGIVEHSANGNPQTIVQEIEPVVLNRIDMVDSDIRRVQEGFRLAMTAARGTARSSFANAPYTSGGKTGTAEAFVNGREVINSSMVAYAPFTNPEIAVSVILPGVEGGWPGAHRLARTAIDAYFEVSNGGNNE